MSPVPAGWPASRPLAVSISVMLEGWAEDQAPGMGPMGNVLRPGVLDLQGRSWAEYGPKTGAWRILEILDAGGRVTQPAHPVVLSRLQGEVRLDGVWTRYGASEEWVLQGVDLAVRPGEAVALVGMTGAGKSTLVQLIPRFYDPERGRVVLDGHDARTLDLRSLRAQIGFVLQDPFLFSASIEDNIRYGRPGASRETVVAAARAAHIADFIESLPAGYATVVGERGVGLSGGQKQRVAIARALVTDPRILILDDATSSIDAENEHLIWDALRHLMSGRTSFIIAHRLASVMFADRIVVLEQGRVAASGSHSELLANSPLYRRVHDLQLAPAEQRVAKGGLLA
jgi:ABC-type multidrug transport system fused ATPase/permease subunit